MQEPRPMLHDARRTTRHRFPQLTFIAAAIVSVVSAVLLTNVASAAEEQSYKALRDWLERSRTVTPQFTPGQHLTEKDRVVLEAFLPQSAWEYYFFPGMEMEIEATGQYPYPTDWGKGLPPGAHLDENGVLVGFTGNALPFPEIKPEDPQAAVKVIWNMLWRPGTQNYVMPMVAWSRSQHGQLDRVLEFTSVS